MNLHNRLQRLLKALPPPPCVACGGRVVDVRCEEDFDRIEPCKVCRAALPPMRFDFTKLGYHTHRIPATEDGLIQARLMAVLAGEMARKFPRDQVQER